MIKFSKLFKLAFVVLLIVLAQGGKGSWAAPSRDVHNQTVPTRTPTAVPATDTPEPTRSTPTSSASTTPVVSSTAPASALTPTGATTRTPGPTPANLPKAGGDATLSLWGGIFLFIAGLGLLWLSDKTWPRRS